MQYRLQFLDVWGKVVRDKHASAATDFDALRIVEEEWPRDAYSTRVYDGNGGLVVSLCQSGWWDSPTESSTLTPAQMFLRSYNRPVPLRIQIPPH